MVKSKAYAEKKMRDRVSTAGPYLKEGMEEGEDPIDVLLKDVEGYAKRLLENLSEAMRRGKFKGGLETAKARDAWKKAIPRAATHFEERADDMVEHAMEDYDDRSKCIEESQKGIKDMPSKTRTNRIAKSAKYQELMGACMDRVKGRKG